MIVGVALKKSDLAHDCEFMKAPIGNKYCHLERIVTILPQGSTNPTDVYVSWEKVDDQ